MPDRTPSQSTLAERRGRYVAATVVFNRGGRSESAVASSGYAQRRPARGNVDLGGSRIARASLPRRRFEVRCPSMGLSLRDVRTAVELPGRDDITARSGTRRSLFSKRPASAVAHVAIPANVSFVCSWQYKSQNVHLGSRCTTISR